MAGFEKEDLVINCCDFGIKGIPCIKVEIETDRYDSYLAIVPGSFLAEIYKKYSSTLLELNVRSFLKFNGGVNKGIRGVLFLTRSLGSLHTITEYLAKGTTLTRKTVSAILQGVRADMLYMFKNNP